MNNLTNILSGITYALSGLQDKSSSTVTQIETISSTIQTSFDDFITDIQFNELSAKLEQIQVDVVDNSIDYASMNDKLSAVNVKLDSFLIDTDPETEQAQQNDYSAVVAKIIQVNTKLDQI